LQTEPAGPRLRVEGLSKKFDGKLVLDGLSFTLARGEVLGILGPNGAGKTTAFLCMCGLLRPDAGSIAFEGTVLGPDRGRTISLIPETPEVYPMLSIWEHFTFVARSARLPTGWEARAEGLITRFGLEPYRDSLGQTLSKGMRQKTLVAATVLADTPILLFDEPMIGLDPLGQRELRDLIRSLAEAGTSIVMSTHLIESAEALCDRLIIMKAGSVVASLSVAALRAQAADGGRSLEDLFLELTAV
jgi:ABC-2 type transport system ATP-binding protein